MKGEELAITPSAEAMQSAVTRPMAPRATGGRRGDLHGKQGNEPRQEIAVLIVGRSKLRRQGRARCPHPRVKLRVFGRCPWLERRAHCLARPRARPSAVCSCRRILAEPARRPGCCVDRQCCSAEAAKVAGTLLSAVSRSIKMSISAMCSAASPLAIGRP